jgi:hypothetical protein
MTGHTTGFLGERKIDVSVLINNDGIKLQNYTTHHVIENLMQVLP